MSATTSARGRVRATAADVAGHVVDGDLEGVVVAEDDHGHRVAHEDDVDAGLVGDAGGGRVVGGDHHQRACRPCGL